MSIKLRKDTARPFTASVQKRGLSVGEAAEYVGLSVALYEKQVKAGIFPARWALEGTRVVFDRVALDQALDRLSGLTPAGVVNAPGAPKDWSAMFERSLAPAPRKKRS